MKNYYVDVLPANRYLFIYLFIYVNEGIIYCSAPCVWEAMMFKIQ